MGALGVEAYVEAARDFLVAEAVSEALEHLRSRGVIRSIIPRTSRSCSRDLLARRSSSITSLVESNASPATRRRTAPMIWFRSAVLCRMPAAPASTARAKSLRSKLAVKISALKPGLGSRSSQINSVLSPSDGERSNIPTSVVVHLVLFKQIQL